MGSLFKSRTTTTKSPFETNPWKPQQGVLREGFTAASAALDKGLGINDTVADMNGGQGAAIGQITNLGMGAGDVSRAALSAGMGGVGRVDRFGANAEGILSDVSRDRTGDILASGEQFASNPFMQGQIDAALGDVAKAFQRTQGDINVAAAGTGNINSTRAGAMEAIAQDEAMDRAAAISSQMRGAAYETGMDRAMGMDAQRTSAMMGANAQVGQAGGMGVDTARTGLGMGIDGATAALGAQDRFQQQQQAEIDGARLSDLDLIQRYMSTVGGNFGSSGYTSTVTRRPSPFQQILGGVTSLAGAGFKMPFMGGGAAAQ